MNASDKVYCVYLHRSIKHGFVFYVGKGTNRRSRAKDGRSVDWKKISSDGGFTVEIVKSGMSSQCAYTLEIITISTMLSAGHPLVNKKIGGQGGIPGLSKYEVFSSLGEKFDGAISAVRWLRNNGYPKADHASIYKCVNGVNGSAYGRGWSKDGFPKHPEFTGRQANIAAIRDSGKSVVDGYGNVFENITEAAKHYDGNQLLNTRVSAIVNCAKGRHKQALGTTWRYA